MGERAISGSVAAISPVQQMLASGTGALLTSIFGEIAKPKTRKNNFKKSINVLFYIGAFCNALSCAHSWFIVTKVLHSLIDTPC